MKFRTRIGLVLGVSGLIAGFLAAPAAHATTWDEVCGTNGKCLNDWSDGSSVRLFTNGILNDAYTLEPVDRCRPGSNQSTAGCPVAGIPAGYFIYQIIDERKANTCVGNDSSGGSFATETTCNGQSYPGTGGGGATIFVTAGSGSCPSGWGLVVSSYWTNHFGGWNAGKLVLGAQGGTNGSLVYLADSSPWCWTGGQFNT
jgi:hypothetical protein